MKKTESIISISPAVRCLYGTPPVLHFARKKIISTKAEIQHIHRTMVYLVLRNCVFAFACKYNCPRENSGKRFKCFVVTCPPRWICLYHSLISRNSTKPLHFRKNKPTFARGLREATTLRLLPMAVFFREPKQLSCLLLALSRFALHQMTRLMFAESEEWLFAAV